MDQVIATIALVRPLTVALLGLTVAITLLSSHLIAVTLLAQLVILQLVSCTAV